MKVLLITQTQIEALHDIGLNYVVADSEGVVYCAHVSEYSSKRYAERFGDVNGRPLTSHKITECTAPSPSPAA